VKAWLKTDPTGAVTRLTSLPNLSPVERQALDAVVNPTKK
jgi:hypothetical protein